MSQEMLAALDRHQGRNRVLLFSPGKPELGVTVLVLDEEKFTMEVFSITHQSVRLTLTFLVIGWRRRLVAGPNPSIEPQISGEIEHFSKEELTQGW